MDTATQDRLRAELERSRDEAVAELRRHGADPDTDRVRQLDGVDDNFADSASATAERAEQLALIDAARGKLTDAEAALARLDAGGYGTCEACGGQIAAPRLEARPTSVLCVDCAAGAQ